jgi:hypothetical protein
VAGVRTGELVAQLVREVARRLPLGDHVAIEGAFRLFRIEERVDDLAHVVRSTQQRCARRSDGGRGRRLGGIAPDATPLNDSMPQT